MESDWFSNFDNDVLLGSFHAVNFALNCEKVTTIPQTPAEWSEKQNDRNNRTVGEGPGFLQTELVKIDQVTIRKIGVCPSFLHFFTYSGLL